MAHDGGTAERDSKYVSTAFIDNVGRNSHGDDRAHLRPRAALQQPSALMPAGS